MKVTAKNILEKWDEIEGYLNDKTHNTFNQGFKVIIKFYDDKPEHAEFKKSIDTFIADVNKQLAKVSDKKSDAAKDDPKVDKMSDKKDDAKSDITIEPTADTKDDTIVETTSSAKPDITIDTYGHGLIVYGPGTTAIKDKLKAMGGEWKKLRKKAAVAFAWIFKPEAKADLEKLIGGEIKKQRIDIITIKGKKYRVTNTKGKFKLVKKTVKGGKTKTDSDAKKDGTKSTKKDSSKDKTEKKAKRTPKPKVGESPNWYKTMRTFSEAAGRTVPIRSVRKMLSDLQDRFDAKRDLKTPHITIIREIQDKILPYANKKTAKVALPAWKELVAKCKTAMKTINVDGKAGYSDMESKSLAGCGRKRK